VPVTCNYSTRGAVTLLILLKVRDTCRNTDLTGRGVTLRGELAAKSPVIPVGVRAVASSSRGRLVVDVRAFDTDHRRALLFAVLDKMVQQGCEDEIVIVTDHDPSGLGYQIDLRKETRGVFEFSNDLRSDGAWVALLRRRRG
jgi:uncharacterized protein (DUF2249 family)